jgi:hypothetical protein
LVVWGIVSRGQRTIYLSVACIRQADHPGGVAMKKTRLAVFVVGLLVLDFLAVRDRAWGQCRLGRRDGRRCIHQRLPSPPRLSSPCEPERQQAIKTDFPQRADEVVVLSGRLDPDDLLAIQRAVLEHSRFLQITERINYIAVKSPEVVNVNTLFVSTPASEGGYFIALKKTNGEWIIASASEYIADKMPPPRPPGHP